MKTKYFLLAISMIVSTLIVAQPKESVKETNSCDKKVLK